MLYMLEMYDEFNESINYLKKNFRPISKGSVFELIIRVVGGLESAYQLSNNPDILDILDYYIEHLLPAFDTKTSLPKPNINMKSKKGETWGYVPRSTYLAHAGSLSLEFMSFSQSSNNPVYRELSDKIFSFLFSKKRFHGFWPQRINFDTGLFGSLDIGLDAYGDSFYEYLLKTYIITEGQCYGCGEAYHQAVIGLKELLLRRTPASTYIGTIKDTLPEDSLTHLSYFVPGMIALGSRYFNESDLDLAIELAETMHSWHNFTATGLSPEGFKVKGGVPVITDSSYKLRPEYIESLFYLYRITGKEKWRDYGWEIFSKIYQYCKVENGFATLADVQNSTKGHIDEQDSFLLSETFKYAYLLFSDSEFYDIDEFVFTTEAHPLRHLNHEWMDQSYDNVSWFRSKDQVKSMKFIFDFNKNQNELKE